MGAAGQIIPFATSRPYDGPGTITGREHGTAIGLGEKDVAGRGGNVQASLPEEKRMVWITHAATHAMRHRRQH